VARGGAPSRQHLQVPILPKVAYWFAKIFVITNNCKLHTLYFCYV
jgi:hypothetical protein